MATRSMIGAQNENGTVQAIYVHWDGYPLGVGYNLLNSFNSEELAYALVEGGSLSTLATRYPGKVSTLEDIHYQNLMSDDDEDGEEYYSGEKYFFDSVEGFMAGGFAGEEFCYLCNLEGDWIVSEVHSEKTEDLLDRCMTDFRRLNPQFIRDSENYFLPMGQRLGDLYSARVAENREAAAA